MVADDPGQVGEKQTGPTTPLEWFMEAVLAGQRDQPAPPPIRPEEG